MLFAVLAAKAYKRNKQYRAAQWVQNIGGAVFGFVYASIWAGIGSESQLGAYGTQGMIQYVAFNQSVINLVLFLTQGLGIEQSVRTGQISLELMRPVPLFYQLMAREWGNIAYMALYRSLPLFIFYAFMLHLRLPTDPAVYGWTALSLICSIYMSICLQFLIGVAALWTTESRWMYWLNYAFHLLLSGFFIPLEWLPGWLRIVSYLSPYPFLQYHTTRLYMGLEGPGAIAGSVLWGIALTMLCLYLTARARRKLEVQGG